MYGNIFIMISYFAYYTVLYLELEKKKLKKHTWRQMRQINFLSGGAMDKTHFDRLSQVM